MHVDCVREVQCLGKCLDRLIDVRDVHCSCIHASLLHHFCTCGNGLSMMHNTLYRLCVGTLMAMALQMVWVSRHACDLECTRSGRSHTSFAGLLAVVCRFYDPTAGNIQIGDYEIRDVTMSSLRSKFGAVPQVCLPLSCLACHSHIE